MIGMKVPGFKAARVPSVGDVFARLTVIAPPSGGGLRLSRDDWECRCSCGNPNSVLVRGQHLLWGHTKSCGCLSREAREARRAHHQVRRAARVSWKTMLRREDAPIFTEWKVSFEVFFTCLGPRPPRTVLSRHDLEAGYEPGNCFWEPRREQFARVRLRRWPNAAAPVASGLRRCSKCGEHKLPSAFYANCSSKTKLHTACKDCTDSSTRAHYKKNLAKYLLSSAKARALAAGIEFALEPEDLVVPAHCPVFGFAMSYGTGRGRTDASYSIDRFDNGLGYVRGNVAVISWLANRLKNDATLSQLERVAAWMRGGREIFRDTAGASEGLL
jgi:hypothetical protein